MKPHLFALISAFSILLAAAIGVIRFLKVTVDSRPFFFLVWIALANEILSEVFLQTVHSTAVNCNIYVLFEAILYCWLFYNWSSLFRNKQKFRLLIVLICVIWFIDNFILNSIFQTNSLFRIISSFILVFLAIDQINQLLMTERSEMLTNARFLISTGVIIFFTYRTIVEAYYLFRLPFSNLFYHNVYLIMDCVNLFVNLIFALAALWIPTRQKFILPS
jgi:hypothetical protein